MVDDIDLINPDLLPPLARHIARAIGLNEMLKLLDAKGGTRIRIPISPDRNESLKGIISDSSIAKLAQTMPNERLDLPKPDKAWAQLRNLSIHLHRKTGQACASQLARKHNLTRRQIINISNRMKTMAAEDDLFGGIDNI